jgi:SAM-dependent methyltransferase
MPGTFSLGTRVSVRGVAPHDGREERISLHREQRCPTLTSIRCGRARTFRRASTTRAASTDPSFGRARQPAPTDSVGAPDPQVRSGPELARPGGLHRGKIRGVSADPGLPAHLTSQAGRELYRLTFDEDAAAYDASRPVPPAEVFDDLVDLAGLERGDRVVEIGPGTGQATRPLLERGLRVLAVEIGAALAALARERLAEFGDTFEIHHANFEEWDTRDTRFDAVFSCNAFHWIDPNLRFVKASSLLKPSGHLIVIGTPWVIPSNASRFWWDVQDDYEAVGGARVDPSSAHPDRVKDLAPLVATSGLFDEPVTRRYLFSVDFTAETYATNLSTQSGIKEFAPDVRAELVDRIRRRVERHGGTITAHLLAVLTVARLRSGLD